jgi:uncharacterized beta-barrel protein YwiB (DUF1934 family)
MKEALIKLKGKVGTGEDVIDFTSIGNVEFNNNNIYIEYDESEMSGTEGAVSAIIISEDAVTLNRMGSWVSTMAFIEGQETPADILTPFGMMKINVFTDKLKLTTEDNHIQLKLSYTFSLGGERIKNYLTLDCQIR